MARAARRKGRDDFRLAFIASKYRLGPEPEPFCLELHLPEGDPWTLVDVTASLQASGEEAQTKAKEAQTKAKEAHQATLDAAAQALYELVAERHATGDPLLKTQAEVYLNKEQEITQRDDRQVIKAQAGKMWIIESRPQGRGKGQAQALLPVSEGVYTPPNDDKQNDVREAAPDKAEEGTLSVTQSQSGRQTNPPASPCGTSAPEHEFVCRDSDVLDDTHPTDNGIDADEGSVGDMCPVCQGEGKISHLYLTLDGGRECLRCLRKGA